MASTPAAERRRIRSRYGLPEGGRETIFSLARRRPARQARDGEQCRLTMMMGGAVAIPDADRPQSEVIFAGNRHFVDRDVDVATDPRSFGGHHGPPALRPLIDR